MVWGWWICRVNFAVSGIVGLLDLGRMIGVLERGGVVLLVDFLLEFRMLPPKLRWNLTTHTNASATNSGIPHPKDLKMQKILIVTLSRLGVWEEPKKHYPMGSF